MAPETLTLGGGGIRQRRSVSSQLRKSHTPNQVSTGKCPFLRKLELCPGRRGSIASANGHPRPNEGPRMMNGHISLPHHSGRDRYLGHGGRAGRFPRPFRQMSIADKWKILGNLREAKNCNRHLRWASAFSMRS